MKNGSPISHQVITYDREKEKKEADESHEKNITCHECDKTFDEAAEVSFINIDIERKYSIQGSIHIEKRDMSN